MILSSIPLGGQGGGGWGTRWWRWARTRQAVLARGAVLCSNWAVPVGWGLLHVLTATVGTPAIACSAQSACSRAPAPPAGRYGQPDEVAGLVRFLALDPAAACESGCGREQRVQALHCSNWGCSVLDACQRASNACCEQEVPGAVAPGWQRRFRSACRDLNWRCRACPAAPQTSPARPLPSTAVSGRSCELLTLVCSLPPPGRVSGVDNCERARS